MAKRSKFVPVDQPLLHPDHPRPRTRRDLIAQGFKMGAGIAAASPFALLSQRINALTISPPNGCSVGAAGNRKIPFIVFDLAGGANIAGSNVLVGQQGGQLDFLMTAGYNKQGLPGDMLPQVNNADPALTDFTDQQFGLAFHSDSQMLMGMREKAGDLATNDVAAFVNGAVIPARSQNDTGNNPHNPMYGIAKAGNEALGLGGAMGEVVGLVGSQNSDSGGNSMAPSGLIDLSLRPTKVDRPADARGLVDLGGLLNLPGQPDEKFAIMEAMYRLGDSKLGAVSTGISGSNGIGGIDDQTLLDAIRCASAQSADLAERFSAGSAALDPVAEPLINGPIFTNAELTGNGRNEREFQKTAAIMKLVVDGYAGAGTVTMGGYDYHTGDRVTGDDRDLRAGRCIGACLQYAASYDNQDGTFGKPLMIYVVSDGSVFSNGTVDGTGKGVWTGDSQQTAAAYFLVYNPTARAVVNTTGSVTDPFQHQQMGYMSPGGDVVTTSGCPGANNVEALVDMITLNYMALHDEVGSYSAQFPNHQLGTDLDRWVAFENIVTGTL